MNTDNPWLVFKRLGTYWSHPSTLRTPALQRGHRFIFHFLRFASRSGSRSGLHSSPGCEKDRHFVQIGLEHLGQATIANIRCFVIVVVLEVVGPVSNEAKLARLSTST